MGGSHYLVYGDSGRLIRAIQFVSEENSFWSRSYSAPHGIYVYGDDSVGDLIDEIGDRLLAFEE